jgi:hypothetical protein
MGKCAKWDIRNEAMVVQKLLKLCHSRAAISCTQISPAMRITGIREPLAEERSIRMVRFLEETDQYTRHCQGLI